MVPDNGYLANVVKSYAEFVETAIKMPWRSAASADTKADTVIEESQQLKGAELILIIKKGFTADWANGVAETSAESVSPQGTPAVP